MKQSSANSKISLPIEIKEMIRVNHAGEMGAKVIYDGQIAALKLKKDNKTLNLVKEMKAQEVEHFEFFDAEMIKKKVRPTLMQPIWKVGGFALGFLTAIIDKKSAMLCTAAVEEVIDEHYQDQIQSLKKRLRNNEILLERESKNSNEITRLEELKKYSHNIKNLCEKIEKFRDDEIEHRDTAYQHQAKDFIGYQPLSFLIKKTTKFAIAVSKKI